MKKIEINNRLRSGMMLTAALLLFLAAAMVVALFFAIEDFSRYKTEKFEEVAGEIEEISKSDEGFYIKLPGNEKFFLVEKPYSKLLTFDEASQKIKKGDGVRILSKRKDSETRFNIMQLEVNGETLFSAEQSIAVYKTGQYINTAAIATILVAAAVSGAIFLRKANKQPAIVAVKWSKLVQSLAPDEVPNPVKKIGAKRTVLYLISVIFYIVAFAVAGGVFGAGFGFWLTVLIGLSLFAAETFLVAVSMKPLRAQQIRMFEKIYDYKIKPDFVPGANNDYDLMNHCSCDFKEEGFFIKSTPLQTMLKGTGEDPFEDFSGAFKLDYQDTDIYAEASYRSWGDMMSVYIITEIKTKQKAIEALNFLYAGEEVEKLSEDADITESDFPFFMFKLDENIYNKLKAAKAPVKELDEILLNRTQNMQKNCKPLIAGGLGRT